MKQRILIVGMHGQVGDAFRRILDNDTNFSVTYTGRSTEIHASQALEICDLTQPDSIRTTIQKVKPHILINCAAYTAVDKAESDRDLAMQVNATAPGIMAAECAQLDALMIHYSTDYVFNGRGSTPWREEDPTDPVNFYGATKLEGERLVQTHGAKHLILRTQWVYSDHGHNFVKTMLRFGREREEMKVVSDQIGAPTSAHVIANSTLDLIRSLNEARCDFGIYHLACSGNVSWHQFAEEIFRQYRELGLPLRVERVLDIRSEEFPTPAKRPMNSRLNLSKIQQALGRVMPDWRDSLKPVISSIAKGSAS